MLNTELLKLLIEQPSKLGLISLNLLRLILTVMILNSFPHLFKYNFYKNIFNFNDNLHIGFIFLYVILVVILWVIIWEIFEPLFSFLLAVKKVKNKEKKDAELREERKDIGNFLKRFNIISVENQDFFIPQKRIHDVGDFLVFIDESNYLNISKSFFSKALYLIVVSWLYLLFNATYINISTWNHFIIGGFVLLLYCLFKAFDRLIIAVDDHSDNLRIELDRLKFRKLVMDAVLKDFRGQLNLENKSFDFNWGRSRYKIFDCYYYHEGIGNAYLLKKMRSASQKDIEGEIIVLNFNPNNQLKKVFDDKKLAGFVVANNHKELLEELVIKLNELEAQKGYLMN